MVYQAAKRRRGTLTAARCSVKEASLYDYNYMTFWKSKSIEIVKRSGFTRTRAFWSNETILMDTVMVAP